MSAWDRAVGSGAAAVQAWRGADRDDADPNRRYRELFAWWTGEWTPRLSGGASSDPLLYKNTRQLLRTPSAIVGFYAQFVYAGDLPDPPQPDTDPAEFRAAVAASALPWTPQTGSEAGDDLLLRAFAAIAERWRWRQHMATIPETAAIFGDLLVELVDDPDHGAVWPRFVRPDEVVDLRLNDVGDVKAYAIEYDVNVAQSDAYGREVAAERYRFRKEVDGDAFRFYRDGRPHAYPTIGPAVQPNPYRFAPATWYRHRLVVGSDRGIGALDATLRPMKEVCSLASNAWDYQRRQFSTPVGVKGTGALNAVRRGVQGAIGRVAGTDPNADPEAEARRTAETLGLWPMTDAGGFEVIQFDIGKTAQMIELVMDAVLAEAPEARYGPKLLEKGQTTGPAMELILAPLAGPVRTVRSNHDPQMVKTFQMATAMQAFRLGRGDYPADVVRDRSAWYEPFAAYDLGSFGRGALDCGLASRPVFAEAPDDTARRLVLVQSLEGETLLRQAGLSTEDAAAVVAERRNAQGAETAAEVAALQRFAGGGNAAAETEGGGDGERD